MTAKPISIKLTGGKSGGCASKAVELTSGDLRHVTEIVTEGEAIHPDRVAEVLLKGMSSEKHFSLPEDQRYFPASSPPATLLTPRL